MEKLKNAELEHVAPESVGVKSKAITNFINEINKKKLGLQSFTVVRHDKICAQCFWKPYSADIPHIMYSMTKSITSTAVGFAISDGLLSLDDKVYKFFPEYNVIDPLNKKLTVRMLLTMRSDKLITVFDEKENHDWIKDYFKAPFLAPPDTKFNYISENTFMLSAIITKVTGKKVVDYLDEKMFKPLGIEKPFWEEDGQGNNAGGWGLYMKSEDLAKFFLPYLHDGKYKGTQLVPEFWVKQATAKQTESVHDGYIDNMCGYGFQFWRNPLANSYRADGLFGQRCFFFPEYDAMVVLNSGQSKDYEIMKVFWKHFPMCFEYGEFEENEKDYKELLNTIENCHTEDLPIKPRNREVEEVLNSKTITCKTNAFTSVISVSILQMLFNKPGKINEMRFNFYDDSLEFYWKEKDFENTIKVGMNGEYGVSKIKYGNLSFTAYSKASWLSKDELALWIRPVETAHIRKFVFRFLQNGEVKIKNESEPKFEELSVYYMVFSGISVSDTVSKIVENTVHNVGLPIVEQDFKGKIQ